MQEITRWLKWNLDVGIAAAARFATFFPHASFERLHQLHLHVLGYGLCFQALEDLKRLFRGVANNPTVWALIHVLLQIGF